MKFNVILTYTERHYPVTGCHNSVETKNAVEALEKVMNFHKVKADDIQEIKVELSVVFPPIDA